MEKLQGFLGFWWVLLIIVALIGYKFFLRIFGIIIIPEDRVGVVVKKFVLFGKNKRLPEGRIVATEGEAGYQAETLAPGVHFWKWPWQYNVSLEKLQEVEKGHIGLVYAKDGNEIPTGKILARKVDSDNFQDAVKFLKNGGQKGRQTAYLTSGLYRINTALFEVTFVKMETIEDGKVGIITTLDGEPLPKGEIAGVEIAGHNNFQDPDVFLAGGGTRGLQTQVVLAGSYNFNPWFVEVEEVPMTSVQIGHVGVVVSYVGPAGVDVTGIEFAHGNIVNKGEKGVWKDPLDPGKYAINTKTMKVEEVPTTNIVLNWAEGRNESHKLDEKLSTITVRSKDGFKFNLDVSQIIHIPSTEASKVIARFGSVSNLVSQVLEPIIGNYFRNSAQNDDVIAFLTSRKERQSSARGHINEVLKQYNVTGVDTLIGDINPPAELMDTLTQRKIAEEMKVTYTTQMEAQETNIALQEKTAVAGMQKQLVEADLNVTIKQKNANGAIETAKGEAESIKIKADANAEQIEKIGTAESKKILAIGTSEAEAYQRQVTAMGQDNFGKFKIAEIIGKEKIKVMPEMLIMGGGGTGGGDTANTTMSALLGFELLKTINAGKLTDVSTEEKKVDEKKPADEKKPEEKKVVDEKKNSDKK